MPDARIGDNGPVSQLPDTGWLDPGFVLLMAGATWRDVPLTLNVARQILDADPNRVGFMVMKESALTAIPRLSPFPAVSTFGLRASADIDVQTVLLQDWLSLVCSEWFALSAQSGTVRVVEFKRPVMG
jgi:hypothetical protein